MLTAVDPKISVASGLVRAVCERGGNVNDGFWDRLAARVRPTDTLKTIENPRAIVRALTAAMWESACSESGSEEPPAHEDIDR